MSNLYYTAKDVQQIMGVSSGMAYKIIKQLNEELKANGYLVVAGRCNKAYFQEKIYGLKAAQSSEERIDSIE